MNMKTIASEYATLKRSVHYNVLADKKEALEVVKDLSESLNEVGLTLLRMSKLDYLDERLQDKLYELSETIAICASSRPHQLSRFIKDRVIVDKM